MANQQTRVALELREMILNGEIPAGAALAEIPLAEKFQVSRTPVRHALAVLEREGLLTKSDSRSYIVRRFRAAEIADAIEVRGVLEGLAARQIAEHGATRGLLRELKSCLAEGDEVIAKLEKGQRVAPELRAAYFAMNTRLHRAIVEGAGNIALASALELVEGFPFAAADSAAFHHASMNDEPPRYIFAHMQHHLIVEAVEAGESARVEALMREHAQVSKRNMNLLRDEPMDLERIDLPALVKAAG